MKLPSKRLDGPSWIEIHWACKAGTSRLLASWRSSVPSQRVLLPLGHDNVLNFFSLLVHARFGTSDSLSVFESTARPVNVTFPSVFTM